MVGGEQHSGVEQIEKGREGSSNSEWWNGALARRWIGKARSVRERPVCGITAPGWVWMRQERELWRGEHARRGDRVESEQGK